MLKILKETFGNKLNQAYTKEGLYVEESVVLKIIYNILLKDIDGFGIGDYTFFSLSNMLENIQNAVLKIYANYDEIKLENGCIICTELPQDYSFAEYVAAMENLSNRLKDDEKCFFDPCLGDDFKIFVLRPKEPLIKSKNSNKNNLKPTTKEELKELINDESIYLGDIDTNLITDMSGLFYNSKRIDFSGINEWDTSNVVNMSCMFLRCDNFNEELSFDTSCVVDMSFMFADSNFNNKLSFNTSNVRDMRGIFLFSATFNHLLDFDTANVKNMNAMFFECLNYNQATDFNTCNVENMNNLFSYCKSLKNLLKFYTDFIAKK